MPNILKVKIKTNDYKNIHSDNKIWIPYVVTQDNEMKTTVKQCLLCYILHFFLHSDMYL